MKKPLLIATALCLGGALWAADSAAVGSEKPAWPQIVEIPLEGSAETAKETAPREVRLEKPESGISLSGMKVEASVMQNAVRVYSSRPATLSLYNASGQLLYRGDQQKPIQMISLQGVNPGFLYLSVRDGQMETVRKLVFTGN